MKKYSELGRKKGCKMLFAIFVVFLLASLTTAIIGFAEGETMKSQGYDPWITKNADVKSWWRDILRNIGYKILLFLAWLINNFDKAIDDLLSINLYTLIKDAFNIKSQIYPIAAAVASAALIFAVIMLFINADKARVSDFMRNILCSVMLIVALPALTSTMNDLKTTGTDYAQNAIDDYSEYEIDSETGIVDKIKLGDRILLQEVYDMGKSIDNNKPENVEGFTKAEAISINLPLNNEYYNRKPAADGVYTNPELISLQTNYKELSDAEKIKLFDRAAAKTNMTYNGLKKDPGIYDYLTTWENSSDDAILLYDNCYYSKVGGRLNRVAGNSNRVYCRVEWNDEANKWIPKYQVFRDDVTDEIIVYVDDVDEDFKNAIAEKNGGVLDLNDYKTIHQRTIKWGDNWTQGRSLGWTEAKQYLMFYDIQNYQAFLCQKLAEMLKDGSQLYTHLPPGAKEKIGNATWVLNNIINASSITEAIASLESTKIEYNGIKLSVMEWLNVDENKAVIEALSEEDEYKSHTWTELRKLEPETTNEFMAAIIEVIGTQYYNEYLYKYHFDFLKSLVMLLITSVCLIFAGFKIASLMFDVLFAQIVAPIALATDMTGSGRGKQVIMNLLGCNICYIVVIFILRLYVTVLNALYEQNYSFLVVVFITFAGAKFVIDGPDLIVKLTGIDAGIKSGMSTLMGLRSAAQLTKGAVQGTVGLAKAPFKLAGGIGKGIGKGVAGAKAISNDIKNADSGRDKAKAATGAVLGHVPVLGSAVKGYKSGFSEAARANQDYANAKSELSGGSSVSAPTTTTGSSTSSAGGGSSAGSTGTAQTLPPRKPTERTGNSNSSSSAGETASSNTNSAHTPPPRKPAENSDNSSSSSNADETASDSAETNTNGSSAVWNTGGSAASPGKKALDPRTVTRKRAKPVEESSNFGGTDTDSLPSGNVSPKDNSLPRSDAGVSAASSEPAEGVSYFGTSGYDGFYYRAFPDPNAPGKFVSSSGSPLSNVKGFNYSGDSDSLKLGTVTPEGKFVRILPSNGFKDSEVFAFVGSGIHGNSVKGYNSSGELVSAFPSSSGFVDSNGSAVSNVGVYGSNGLDPNISIVARPVVSSPAVTAASAAGSGGSSEVAAPFSSTGYSNYSPIDEYYYSEAASDSSSFSDFDPYDAGSDSGGGFYDASDFTSSRTQSSGRSDRPRKKFDPNKKKK